MIINMVRIKDKPTGLFGKPHFICVYICSIPRNFLKRRDLDFMGESPFVRFGSNNPFMAYLET